MKRIGTILAAGVVSITLCTFIFGVWNTPEELDEHVEEYDLHLSQKHGKVEESMAQLCTDVALVEQRVEGMEKTVEKMDGKLDRLLERTP